MPVSNGGTHVGSVEFGMSFGPAFFESFKKQFGVDAALYVQEKQVFKTFATTMGKVEIIGEAQFEKAFKGTPVVFHTELNGVPVAVFAGPIADFSGKTVGVAVIAANVNDYVAAMTNSWQTSLAMGAAILALGLLVAGMIGHRLSAPISRMTAAMGRLAEGDLDVEIPTEGRRDEIGSMAAAVQVFKDNAIRTKDLEEEQIAQKRRAEEEKQAAMNKMADQFETSVGEVVERVSSAATEMQSSSAAMNATAEETTRQATAVAAASEQASANVQTVASAAEELSGSIAEISRQVTQASQIASAAVTEAERTNIKVQGLAQAANKIGEVVALITDIAEQTNLLALNATIEAARAGDAGKGFAVVASEVKNLANQTAKATDEIGAQIAGIQSATQEAVSAIEGISKTISQINEVNSGVASAVEEQGAATQEIARNVEQAAVGTHEVSSNIAGVNQAANETGNAATQIQSTAADLSRQSGLLRREVGKFLAQVRADRSQTKLLEWTDDLVCGIAEIDRDHRRLVDMANDAYGQMMAGEGIAAGPLVKELGSLVVQHFTDEERVMSRIGYPDVAQHKKIHQDLVERFDALRRRFENGDKDAGKDLFVYLAEWLKDHTFNQDRAFIAFARKRGKENLLRVA